MWTPLSPCFCLLMVWGFCSQFGPLVLKKRKLNATVIFQRVDFIQHVLKIFNHYYITNIILQTCPFVYIPTYTVTLRFFQIEVIKVTNVFDQVKVLQTDVLSELESVINLVSPFLACCFDIKNFLRERPGNINTNPKIAD